MSERHISANSITINLDQCPIKFVKDGKTIELDDYIRRIVEESYVSHKIMKLELDHKCLLNALKRQ